MPSCSVCGRPITGRFPTGKCAGCAVKAANARRVAERKEKAGDHPRHYARRGTHVAPLLACQDDPPAHAVEAPEIIERVSGRGVPDIVEFVCDPKYLGPDDQISPAQVAVLKAIYGLAMSAEEEAAFLSMTDGRKARKGGYSEAWIIAGRRSGKTDKVLANVAVYETFVFDDSMLSPGETAFFPLVAQNVDGASRARGYIEGKLLRLEERGWEILDHGSAQERAITGREIRTSKGVTIRCFPCTKAAVRGATAIGYGTDEVAWWQTEEGAYNADREVFRALKPTVATMGRRAKRINVSSPYAEEGMLWEVWERRDTTQSLVVNAPSWTFNPNLPVEFLAEQQMDDPICYLREYGAQFGKEGGGYFTPDEIDRVIDRARPLMLPHDSHFEYCGVLDVGFKHDLYVALVARREGDAVNVAAVKTWQGSKKRPLDGEVVAREAAEMFRSYGVDAVTTDQYSDIQVIKDYSKHGIRVNVEPESEQTGFEKFKNLKAVIRRGLVTLPNDPVIRKDLLSLRKMTGSRHPKIAAPQRHGFHDDVSNALAKAIMRLLPIAQRIDLSAINAAGAVGGGLAHIEGEESWQRKQRQERSGGEEPDFSGGMMERVF